MSISREEKLLNMLMGDGASDGEIINARNMLKKMNVKLSIGGNNYSEEYINLFRKHTNLQSEYQNLYNKYNYIYREYTNAKRQCSNGTVEQDKYIKLNEELSKRLVDREMKIYFQTLLIKVLCAISICLTISVLFVIHKNKENYNSTAYNLQKEIESVINTRNNTYKEPIIKELMKLEKYPMTIDMRKKIYVDKNKDADLTSVQFEDLYEEFIKTTHEKLYNVKLKYVNVYRSFNNYEITLYYDKGVK